MNYTNQITRCKYSSVKVHSGEYKAIREDDTSNESSFGRRLVEKKLHFRFRGDTREHTQKIGSKEEGADMCRR